MIFRRRDKKADVAVAAESGVPTDDSADDSDDTEAIADSEAIADTDDTDDDTDDETDHDAGDTEAAERATARDAGPFDSAEVAMEPDAGGRLDLGSLLIGGPPGMQVQLQVDEETQAVQAALLVLEESALELRAFAAPKSRGIKTEVLAEMTAEATRMGGTASASSGPFGAELNIVVPVQDPDGNAFEQQSRVIGVDGPRWFLRGTILGRAATEPKAAAPIENCFRDVIVVRGDEAMAPREPLPLTLPEQPPDEISDAISQPGADPSQR